MSLRAEFEPLRLSPDGLHPDAESCRKAWDRETSSDARLEAMVALAAEWLALCTKSKSVNRRVPSSYGLKSIASRWHGQDGFGPMILNGCFLMAADRAGFDMEPQPPHFVHKLKRTTATHGSTLPLGRMTKTRGPEASRGRNTAMSGVSITSGAPDLDAIISGGAEFVARLKTFQEQKAAAENAINDLHLGNGARAALDEASRHLESAKQEASDIRNAAAADARKVRDSVAQWKQETENAASLARAQAESHLAAAAKKHDEAEKRLAAAKDCVDLDQRDRCVAAIRPLQRAPDKAACV
jgi:hypothetical protein